MTSSQPAPARPGMARLLWELSGDVTRLAGQLATGTVGDTRLAAEAAGRLSAQLAEAAESLRALPGVLVQDEAYQWQLLAALRTAHAAGTDLAAVLGVALARLAAELGSMAAVTAARPGSWEAALVRQLLEGTAGDDARLACWRASQ